ncbi:LysR family transcriptional regulator [Rhodovibrionaceae bacterium A322]
MDLRQLRTFVHVAELQSISAAAERLNIAQPALSRQIQALEQELEVRLLHRHGRGVTLTDPGELLRDRAQLILREVERLQGDLRSQDGKLRGSLSLGLPPTVASVLATPLIERTYLEHPEVKLKVVSGFSGYVQDWIQRGVVDLGVTYEGHEAATIKSTPLLEEEIFLVKKASPETLKMKRGQGLPGPAVTRQAAFAKKLILPSGPHGLRTIVDKAAQATEQDLKVVLENDSLPTLVQLVKRGLGATLLPLVSVFDEVQAGQLQAQPIRDPGLTRRLLLSRPIDRPSTPLAQQFAQMLVEEIGDLVQKGRWPGTVL